MMLATSIVTLLLVNQELAGIMKMLATSLVTLLLVKQVESLCNGQADVMIAIDNSGSMGGNYGHVLSVLHDTVSAFEIGPNAFQVGVISFPHTGKCFDLDQYTTSAGLLNALKSPSVPASKRCVTDWRSGIAIEKMYNTYFTAVRGGRPNAKKIGIVVTDGFTDLHVAKNRSDIARQKGISLFAIGTGSWGLNLDELSAIGGSLSNVFELSVGNLTGLVESLIPLVCTAVVDPLYCDRTIEGIPNHYVPNSGCSTFQQSVAGQDAFTQVCPAGLLFTTRLCWCDYPANVKCPV